MKKTDLHLKQRKLIYKETQENRLEKSAFTTKWKYLRQPLKKQRTVSLNETSPWTVSQANTVSVFSSGQFCWEMAFAASACTTLVLWILVWWLVTDSGFRILASSACKIRTARSQRGHSILNMRKSLTTVVIRTLVNIYFDSFDKQQMPWPERNINPIPTFWGKLVA